MPHRLGVGNGPSRPNPRRAASTSRRAIDLMLKLGRPRDCQTRIRMIVEEHRNRIALACSRPRFDRKQDLLRIAGAPPHRRENRESGGLGSTPSGLDQQCSFKASDRTYIRSSARRLHQASQSDPSPHATPGYQQIVNPILTAPKSPNKRAFLERVGSQITEAISCLSLFWSKPTP